MFVFRLFKALAMVDHIRISNLFKPHKTRDDATTWHARKRSGGEDRGGRGGITRWKKRLGEKTRDILSWCSSISRDPCALLRWGENLADELYTNNLEFWILPQQLHYFILMTMDAPKKKKLLKHQWKDRLYFTQVWRGLSQTSPGPPSSLGPFIPDPSSYSIQGVVKKLCMHLETKTTAT